MEKIASFGRPVPEIPVRNVERAQKHYRDVLGFEIRWLSPNKSIGAVAHPEMGPMFFREMRPPFDSVIHWVFAQDINNSYQNLESAGATIVDPLQKKSWGLWQFTVRDLDGHLFYFHHD